LTVPAAAQRHLEDMLGFELDRETPFSRDEIHWDYRIVRRDKVRGTILVDLAVVPRASVDPALASLRSAGFIPVGIEAGDGEDGAVTIRLEHGGGRPDWWRERSLVPVAGLACILTLAALVTPFLRQHDALASVERMIEQSTASAKEAASLRQRLDQRAATVADVSAERERSGSALAALAAVTRALPDDTYLTALNVHQGRVVITGLAPSAATLVRSISQTGGLSDPAFESQVVTNESGGVEAFRISVSVKSVVKP